MAYFRCTGPCKNRVFMSDFAKEVKGVKISPPCPMCESPTEKVYKPKAKEKRYSNTANHKYARRYELTH